MDKFIAQIRVIAQSWITRLSAVAVLVTTFAGDIANIAPDPYADDIVKVGVTVAAWLATAIAALRLVAPVPPAERGVLPPD
jgi:hypothetical protein